MIPKNVRNLKVIALSISGFNKNYIIFIEYYFIDIYQFNNVSFNFADCLPQMLPTIEKEIDNSGVIFNLKYPDSLFLPLNSKKIFYPESSYLE